MIWRDSKVTWNITVDYSAELPVNTGYFRSDIARVVEGVITLTITDDIIAHLDIGIPPDGHALINRSIKI
jgi:hypothetical protein